MACWKASLGSFLVLALVISLAGASQIENVFPKPLKASTGHASAQLSCSSVKLQGHERSSILSTQTEKLIAKLCSPKLHHSQDLLGNMPLVDIIAIDVVNPNAELVLGVDESYELSVSEHGEVDIRASTPFGALYAVDTLSQLVQFNRTDGVSLLTELPIHIKDSPRFQWRGMLVDTARHYLKVDTLLHIVDALALSRLNTMHWHIVDAQSFPMRLDGLENLADKGAWTPDAVYSPEDIAKVIQHANAVGVRVIPEIDIPGHAASWGAAYPDAVAHCPSLEHNINNVPLNVASEQTYELVQKILSGAAQAFGGEFIHTGGDEVVYQCWAEDKKVARWMKHMGFTTQPQVENYFESRLQPIVKSLNRTMIVWQELFNDGVQLDDDVIVHVWKDQPTLMQVLDGGRKAIMSAGWYLDQQTPNRTDLHYEWEDTWKDFWQLFLDVGESKEHLLLGGEAAMWSEQVDDVNFDSRVWPRACAIAERMWLPVSESDIDAALTRLEAQRCRIVKAGINAGPLQPGPPCL